MPQSFTTSFLRRNLLFAFLLLFISNSTLHAQGDPAELRSVWSNPEADPKDRIQSWLELSLLLTNDNEQYGILMEMVQLGAEPESEFRNYALLSEGIVNQFFIRNMTEAESKWLQLLNEDDSAFVASATYFLIGMKEGEEKSALIESLVAYVLRTSQEHMPVIPFVGPIDALAFAVSEEEAKADQDKLFAHYSSVIEYQIKIGDNEKAMQSAIQAGDGMWRWLREKEQAIGFYQQGLQLAKEDPKFSLFKDQLKQRILAIEKGSSVRKAVEPAVVRQVQAVHSGPVQPIEISRKSFDRSKYDLHKVDSVIGITGDTTWRSEMLPPVETMAEIDTFILGLPQKTRALPPVFSENGTHNFQYLWADQGLPDGIGGIQQDPLGNIWIVSTNALTRYDGEYFYSYTVNEGMPDILLDRFLIDSKGVIWISVEGGLLKYDGHQLLWYKNLICQFIFEDLEGNIWTSKQMSQVGLTRIEEDRYFNYSQGQGLAARINSIAQAPDGSYWITSDNTGVFRMDSTSIVQYNHKHGLIDWRAQEVVVTSDGSVWMSIFSVQNNRMGLHQIKNGNLYSWDSEWGLSMRHMIKDSQDQIWMMNGNFLMSFDGKTTHSYRENEGFQCEKGLSIIEDDAHHIWCASLDGLVCFNDNGFEGLPFVENAIAYVPKNDHDIWVYSSFNDDVVRFQDGDMINYDFSQNFEHSPISMYEDSKGNTWFGSFSGNGLLKFDGENTYAYDHTSGLSNPWVPTIDEDLNGNIWLGTYGGGAVKFDGELFHIYEANLNDFFNETYLFSQSIISNKTTSDGSVWMGAQGGLTQLKDGKYTTYRTADGFPLKYVLDIQEAPGGGVFVSGEAGVFHVKDDEVINLTTKYGFPFTVTYAVLMDDQGSLWANGGSQLAVRRKDGVVMVFNRQDGLRSAQECFFTQTDDGTIYIGGTPGNAINRDKLFKQDLAKKPRIRLYSVIVYDQHFGFRQAKVADTLLEDSIEHRNYAGIQFSGVNAFTEVPQNLVLPYNMNELNFGFSGYDWRAQDKLEYSYRLIGGNDQWSKPGKGQEAKYTNLDYGDYTFEVKVKNRYGVWSDVESYSFVITPPWWHTWWARALYVVALLLSVFAYVRWRTAALKQRQKELETEVELATIDIRKKKDQIEKEKERSDELLLNILPSEVADELKEKGSSDARLMDEVSVLFTDFKGFTAMSENLSPKQLVDDLHDCFSAFDKICEKHGIEKIKTIGDAYMAAAGIPTAKESHVEDVIEAALEIRDYIEQMKKKKAEAGELYFEIRIGVHTGPVVAGIVGIKKFQYDIWGDTVNTASRMESSGSPGKVNISDPAYQLIKDDARFTFEERGKVMAKGKGELTMWFVERKGE